MKVIRYFLILLGLLPIRALAQDVTYQRLLHSDSEPQNWLMYDGDYQSHRFSQLKQINKANVAGLRAAWVYQITRTGYIENAPIVADGLMYVAEVPDTVVALDPRTGAKIWSFTPALKEINEVGAGFGPGQTTRGVAILNGTVYLGTLDDHLYALDAKTGAVRWNATVIESDAWANAFAITEAPMAIDGKIIVGAGGGEGPVRGFLDAYDAKTGKRLWRVYAVPKPGEPGSETWAGKSAESGGSTMWNQGSYDPELNLLYFGTGNPAPDYNGSARAGDNLFSCSMLAIDANTGIVKWYFQFSPHDTHDWDAVQVPILFEGTIDGKPRKLLAQANRNGFYYVLDRETGEFITAKPFVKQTWAKGIDAKGRPIQMPNNEPTPEGNLIYPAVTGGSNWTSPSYDPDRKLFYVQAREMGSVFLAGDPEYDPTKPLRVQSAAGGGFNALSGDEAYGAIRALDVMTGELKWEFRLRAPAWTGVLTTAGGLLFSQSDEGDFFALDSDTGKPLWHIALGGNNPRSNPVTYEVDGKQYVIVASGNLYMAFALPDTR